MSVFFFKLRTAYEVRIRDWSSYVCSSDLAGSAIGGARQTFRWTEQHSPLRRNVSLEELGGAALYLLSELSHAVTGEVHHVDSGYNIISVPGRSDERRVGKECVSTCRSGWSPYH